MLRGRCGCRAVQYEVAGEFIVAYNCHCSNCRATTGSAVIEDNGPDHAMGCRECWSLVYFTRTTPEGIYVRVPYGTRIDEPALRPMAHMFVGSKAPWYEISDDLPQHDEYPWDS